MLRAGMERFQFSRTVAINPSRDLSQGTSIAEVKKRSEDKFRNRLYRAMYAAGIERETRMYRLHIFRRTVWTLIDNEFGDLNLVQGILGHSSIVEFSSPKPRLPRLQTSWQRKSVHQRCLTKSLSHNWSQVMITNYCQWAS